MIYEEVETMDWDEGTVDNLIKDMTRIRDKYGLDTKIQRTRIPYDDDFYYAVLQAREETDAEYNQRLEREKYYEQRKAEQQKADYERLKKIFEGNKQ
jgi:hypothetical protein